MGFLKKLGLVEENPDYYADDNTDYSNGNYDESSVDANVEGVTTENLVDDIYKANSLEDLSKSIFKVDEVINSLPKEMATETKKATVLAILTSFGLTTDEVVQDGITRINFLKSAMNEILTKNNSEIESSNVSIEEYKKEIEELSKYIANLVVINKNCEDTVEQELSKIEELIKFVGGEI